MKGEGPFPRERERLTKSVNRLAVRNLPATNL
jgi:hypothetical protein